MHASTLTFHQERILAVLLHIQQHLDEELSLERLARVAHLSPFHMHRIFRALVGEGVAEHVRRLRLERAAVRLKYGRESVLEIALEAGFESHEAFTRAFSALFGEPPSRFRKAHHERIFAPAPSGVHYDPNGDLSAFCPLVPEFQPLDVRVEQWEPLEVAFVRRTGDYHRSAPQAWERLMSWSGGHPDGDTRAFGICLDDPTVTPVAHVRYDAAIPWRDWMDIGGDVGRQVVEGGTYLCASVTVPAVDHNPAWTAFMAWVLNSPWQPRLLPSMERYMGHVDPRTGMHVVELLMPVEAASGI